MAAANNTQTTPTSWPRPSHPLYVMLERAGFGLCDFETNIQEKDAPT